MELPSEDAWMDGGMVNDSESESFTMDADVVSEPPPTLWQRFKARLGGLKTFAVSLVFMVFGMLDQLDLVSIMGWVKETFTENVRVGSIIIAVVLCFIALRFITKGPHGFSRAKATEEE